MDLSRSEKRGPEAELETELQKGDFCLSFALVKKRELIEAVG
jgi:hypothetical protein